MEKWANSFYGFRRENGRVGVRNHVVILPVDDISNYRYWTQSECGGSNRDWHRTGMD